jgi:hypothetical protein
MKEGANRHPDILGRRKETITTSGKGDLRAVVVVVDQGHGTQNLSRWGRLSPYGHIPDAAEAG